MTRNLTSEVQDAIESDYVRPFFLYEGVFASSTLRLWSGTGDLTWNSQTWLGNGWFAGIPVVPENNEIRSNGINVVLNGVPQALVSLILSEARHSSTGRLWLGLFDDNGDIIEDPYLLFEGKLSSPRIDDSADGSEINLSYEDSLIVLQRASELRYNHESQQTLFPGDLGFAYVAGLQNWSGFWGKKQRAKKKSDKTSRKKDKRGRQ